MKILQFQNFRVLLLTQLWTQFILKKYQNQKIRWLTITAKNHFYIRNYLL
jgi:hypothetical protein